MKRLLCTICANELVGNPPTCAVCESLPTESELQLADYVILNEIASGAMGIVYRARQMSLGREVALKMIHPQVAASAEALNRFALEAAASAKLDHPHIVPVFEIGRHLDRPFFSMKLIRGKSLADELGEATKPGRDQIRKRVEILRKICEAVAYAHQHGILHRDLKPGNILIDQDGTPYLSDFGIAKLTEANFGQTRAGQILGTYEYMAPEQARGGVDKATIASDVYALGAILFHLVTGSFVFGLNKDEGEGDLIKKIMDNSPPQPRAINPVISVDLQTICLKALSKNPAERYASADELGADLDNWIQRRPINARSPTRLGRFVKTVQRNPISSAFAALFVASLMAGLAGVTWQWRKTVSARMEVVQNIGKLRLQRAEDLVNAGNSPMALALLARSLRDDPANRAAAERIVHLLWQRRFLLATSWQGPALEDPQTAFRIVRDAASQFSASVTNTNDFVLTSILGESSYVSNAHSKVIRSLTASSDKRLVVTASADATVKMWRVEPASLMATFKHPVPAEFAEISLNNQWAVTADRSGTIRIWRVSDGRELLKWQAHQGPANVARFNSDGSLLTTGGDDGVIKVFETATGKEYCEPLSIGAPVLDVRWHGESLAALIHPGKSHALKFTQKRRPLIAPPSIAGLPTLEPIESILGKPSTNFHSAAVTFTNISSDHRLLATASVDQTARIWSIPGFRPLTDPLLHQAAVNCARFSPDSLRVATSCADGSARVWDVSSGAPLTDYFVAGEPIDSVVFKEDGQSLVASPGLIWPIYAATTPVGNWLPDLAEQIARVRINSNGLTERLDLLPFDARVVQLKKEAGDNDASWVENLLARF